MKPADASHFEPLSHEVRAVFRQIRWRVAFYYMLLILVSLGAISWHIAQTVRARHIADLRAQLLTEARTVGEAAGMVLVSPELGPAMDRLAKRYAGILGARVTIMAVDGTVLGDSEENWAAMDNHLTRPEVQQALLVGEGSSIRFSRTTGLDTMYTAARTALGGRTTLIARTALPLTRIDSSISALLREVWSTALAVLAVALLVALAVAEATARPVRRLTELAQRLAQGDLAARAVPGTSDEVGTLARAFNRMADHLGDSIVRLADERGRLSAVLDHMADGIVITDGQGLVSLINPSATRLLGISQSGALGRSFAQVVRDHRLIRIWEQCRSSPEKCTETLDADQNGSLLRVVVTRLQGIDTNECMVLLQDHGQASAPA